MLYQISNGRVMFAADTILEHVDFEVKNKTDKIAVIGRNGAGKTTLLKVITYFNRYGCFFVSLCAQFRMCVHESAVKRLFE